MSSQSAEVGRVGSNKLVYFFGALGGLLFGYDTGVIAGAILFINEDLGLSPFTSGLVVSSLLVGAMIGAAFAGPIADARPGLPLRRGPAGPRVGEVLRGRWPAPEDGQDDGPR